MKKFKLTFSFLIIIAIGMLTFASPPINAAQIKENNAGTPTATLVFEEVAPNVAIITEPLIATTGNTNEVGTSAKSTISPVIKTDGEEAQNSMAQIAATANFSLTAKNTTAVHIAGVGNKRLNNKFK